MLEETINVIKDCFSKNQNKPSAIKKVISDKKVPPLSNLHIYNLKSLLTHEQ